MFRWFTLLAFLFVAEASAAVPELPGDGVDNGTSSGTAGSCPGGYADAVYGTGCDLLAPGLDKDRDGYTSDGSMGAAGVTQKDCDDTNKRIFPGRHRKGACSGSDYQTCQPSGAYTACLTGPLNEATGSGRAYYVDCGAGNDTNPGTYASPYLTLGKLSGGADGTPPGGAVTLVAGDVVYVIGSTACTTTFNGNIGGFSVPVLLSSYADGTSSNPIRIKRYPGSTALLTVTNGSAFYILGDYWKVEDFQGSTTYSSSIKTGFVVGSGANYIEAVNNYVTSAPGHGDYNHGGMYFGHSNFTNIHHNFIGEPTVSTGTLENGAGLFWLDDEDIGEGQGHSATFNTIYYNSYSNTVNSSCWRTKHGVDLEDAGASGHTIAYSTCVNPRRVLALNGSGVRATRLLAYTDGAGNDASTSVQSVARIWVDGFTTPHEDNRISYSTFINFSMLNWSEPAYSSAAEKLTFNNNVIVDNDATYGTGNSEGIISIDGYGSDAQLSTLLSQGSLAINNNCYYNASAGLSFSFFNQPAGFGHGPSGAGGGDYNFAGWQSATGQDAASFVQNPTFDTYYRSTAANCANKGFLLTSEEFPVLTSGRAVDARRRHRNTEMLNSRRPEDAVK